MSILGTIKNVASKAVSAVKSIVSPASQSAGAINALNRSIAPNQTLLPNISTPQGMGQTQPNGSTTLLNQHGRPTGSVINSSGVGSTPLPSSPNSPLYSPSVSSSAPKTTPTPASTLFSSPTIASASPQFSNSQSTASYTPQTPQSAEVYSSNSNPFSNATNALNRPLDNGVSNSNNLAGTGFASTTPSTPASTATDITQTATPVAQTTPKISDQYSVITQDKNADSGKLKQGIDQIKQQEDAQTQVQIQQIQTQLAAKKAELAALQAQNPEQSAEQPTQPFAYNPQGNTNISELTAQIQAMESEINKALEGSPEYQAANKALNDKISEEAMIRANLTKGQANVGEQPVAYSFISGQQAALARQAQADLGVNAAQQIPLTQQLATEQAKKQAAIDVAKTKYSYLADERKNATDVYKTNYERANTVADKATTQANALALQAAKPKTTTTSSVGQPKGTSTSNITALKNALNASKFQGSEADGQYADPNLYLSNYQNWLASGGTKEEFFRNFPPTTYINPANTWLPQEIMQFATKQTY